MGQSILLKRSAIPGKKPSANSLNLGEIALNTYDGRIFFKRSGSVESVQEVITTNSINTGSINLYGGVNNQNYLLNITGYNDYFQGAYLQNLSNSVSASSDIAIYNDNGTSYVDIGINSTTYQSSSEAFTTLGQQGDAYVYASANDFYIGNATPGKELIIFNGGFNTNQYAKIRVHDQGSIVINSGQSYNQTYPEALVVNAAPGSDYNLITAYNNTNNYSQINTQNLNSGSDASTDVVVTADNGDELLYYVDLGINSSGYTAGIVGESNDGYLINAGKNFYIGTQGDNYYSTNPSANLYLFTNDSWQNPEIMISGSHVVGFGTTNVTNGYKYEFDGGDIKINNNVLIIGTLYATASNAISASYALTASYALNAGGGAGFPFSGSAIITGSLLVSGSGLTILGNTNLQNITASSLLVNGTITAQTLIVQTITASVEYASGSTRFGSSSANTHQFTGSVLVSGSVTATSFIGDGSGITNIQASSVNGLNLYRIASGSITASVQSGSFAVNSNTQISGTLIVSSSISASNINVGVPTSNDWGANLQGSYFNNFTTQTNVSEILRFIAGLLSSSAPDASPNTKTFGSISATAVNTTTGTAPAGSIPQTSTNTTIIYLNSKGFATVGSTIFSGIPTIYNSNYGYNYSSVAAGSSTISSSADAQLFGLGNLSSGTPTSFNVSGSFTFRFKDNSTKTDTATSASQVLLTQTGAGTTNGVSLAKINTVNTAVIPPAYQDGKFASTLTQYLYSGSATAVSASGYYHVSASVRISSGSSTYSNIASASAEIFWAPTTTISTNIPAQTPTTGSTTTSAITAVSRSLSGAPYLSSATYTISSSITNPFNPMYYAGSGISSITLSGTGISLTSGVSTVTTAGGTIGTANAVYDSTGVTVRATSTVPFETDIIKVNGLYTLSTANITNIGQSSNTPTTFTLGINGINKDGTTTTKNNTLSYHTAGTFGQPVASGSLAYYTRTQGADTATTSGSSNSEPFTGENYRIQLTDSILSFTGLQWNTTYGVYNLGGNDLQVKPGYLVKPGGTYGYWLADPDTTKTYKYYVRQITTNGGTKTSMTLNVGQTLVNWGTTTNNAIGALILFQSSKTPTYTTARLYDPSDLLNNFVATKTANTNGQNPFGINFDLYGNTGGSLATTTYTIPLRNADGMTLDASNTNIYVILRYNGDPTPITSMTVTFA